MSDNDDKGPDSINEKRGSLVSRQSQIVFGAVLPKQVPDPWVKIVGMLQHNWATIEPAPDGAVIVWYYSDTSRVFDQMTFTSAAEAEAGLRRNGFVRHAEDPFPELVPPGPLRQGSHPSGAIYSSGQYWK